MTNAFTPKPEPTRQCNICKGIFEYKYLAVKQGGVGVRPLCKQCRQAQQKQAYHARQARAKEAKVIVLRKDPAATPPMTYTTLKDPATWSGWTQRQYIRNDGLKHIPSRGAI